MEARLAIVLSLLLAWPIASAGDTVLTLRTAEPTRFDGELTATISDAAMYWDTHDARGDVVFRNVTGELELVSTRCVDTRSGPVRVQQPCEAPTREAIRLGDATLRLQFAGEPFHFEAAGDAGGIIEATAEGAISGRPSWLAAGERSEVAEFGAGRHVQWSWNEGDPWFGSSGGFPANGMRELSMSGPFKALLRGGVLVIEDQGESIERSLRAVRETPALTGTQVGRYNETEALMTGRIGAATFAPGGTWIVAGPRVGWRLDGEVVWEHADGEHAGLGFTDSRVAGRGVLSLVPSRAEGFAVARADGFEVVGNWEELQIGATRIAVDQEDVATSAETLGILAAIGVLAFVIFRFGPQAAGVLAAMYTRISPDEILAHATRRALLDLVVADPGIHLRELHRRVGGAWGPFTFHIRMLENAGHLRLTREGRYLAAYASTAVAPEAAAIRNEVARGVYDALPDDGGFVDLSWLRDRAGISRQLLSYHVRALARDGHVRVESVGRARRVGRSKIAHPEKHGVPRVSMPATPAWQES